jgi:hypothetical protein
MRLQPNEDREIFCAASIKEVWWKSVFFGPVSQTLDQLSTLGFELILFGKLRYPSQVGRFKLHLQRKKDSRFERYLVTRVTWDQIVKCENLEDLVPDNQQLMRTSDLLVREQERVVARSRMPASTPLGNRTLGEVAEEIINSAIGNMT